MKIKRAKRSHVVIPIVEKSISSESSGIAFYDTGNELYDLAITQIEKSAETYKRYDRRGTMLQAKIRSTLEKKA